MVHSLNEEKSSSILSGILTVISILSLVLSAYIFIDARLDNVDRSLDGIDRKIDGSWSITSMGLWAEELRQRNTDVDVPPVQVRTQNK